jgi:hypothetical protein
MQLSIDISDNKASAFIAFLKTLDFVKVKLSDPDFEFSAKQKNELIKRHKEYKKNTTSCSDWDSVSTEIEKRL